MAATLADALNAASTLVLDGQRLNAKANYLRHSLRRRKAARPNPLVALGPPVTSRSITRWLFLID
jgi:hypothetical protein